ncbi:MAG: hypothetical protein GY854_34710 [Deltaproteobacteria bacterium]|nr:hypothetical protein [Deltaproteobacteria bacterium]
MRRLALGILLVTLLAPAIAQAYIPSPQYGAFELKLGPYKPALDKSLRGSPYEEFFGDELMLLTQLELDWQFLHPPGFSIGVGGSVGFMQECKKSVLLDEEGAQTDEESADYSVLNVIPFAGLLVVRIDALADMLDVPLVPFFKIGINWYLWWILNAGNTDTIETEDNNGEVIDTSKARGGTLGWQVNTGLMFRLDSFDPMSARTFDNEAGVNHSYLFAEIVWAWVDRFGDDDYINLSTDTFANATIMFGLALEF